MTLQSDKPVKLESTCIYTGCNYPKSLCIGECKSDKSDTPRTDEELRKMPIRPHPENDFVKFTCQLERELAETKRLLAEAQKVISGMYFGCNPNGELLTRIDAAIKEQK